MSAHCGYHCCAWKRGATADDVIGRLFGAACVVLAVVLLMPVPLGVVGR